MNIPELLNLNEDEHTEFKQAKNTFEFDKLAQYACALSNRGGGRIVFGITDKRPRQVVGSQAFEQPEKTRQTLMNDLGVNVSFEVVDFNGLRVLVFTVASRPIGLPIQYDGKYWWRHGESLVPMPADVLGSIYSESGHDFSADVCSRATINDLDLKAVERFRKKWIKKSGLDRLNALSIEQLLKDCEAITDEGITYAALILFGKKSSLSKFLGQSEIVFEYRSSEASGPAQQREEFRDAFFNIYDRIWELINLRNNKQHYQDGLFVFDIDTFNERAIREALLNAVCHRNYQLCGSVFVKQYQNRLIISSPGGFPHGITTENILDKQSPRNRRIAELLAKCGLVERSGQGMNLIFETCVKEAKALPDFTGTDENEVCITLHGVVLNENLLRLINKVNSETLNHFSTQDFLALSLLSQNEKIPSTFKSSIESLLEIGLIEFNNQGQYMLSRKYYTASGRAGAYTRRQGLERETNKALLLKHIKHQNETGASFKEFTQVLPALTSGQIKGLLNDIKQEGSAYSVGRGKSAKWFLKSK